jgi:hypothetical protein
MENSVESLPANGKCTDHAEALRPTPPGPPFTREGKVSAAAGLCATKTFLWRSTLQPRERQLCTTPGRASVSSGSGGASPSRYPASPNN